MLDEKNECREIKHAWDNIQVRFNIETTLSKIVDRKKICGKT